MPKAKAEKKNRIHSKAPSAANLLPTQPAVVEVAPAVNEPSEYVYERSKRDMAVKQRIQALQDKTQPYSKSHSKRLKRKAAQSLTADLGEVDDVLNQLQPEIEAKTQTPASSTAKSAPKQVLNNGGKLTSAKRATILKEAQDRLPKLLQHQAYRANPFEAIRIHAQNSHGMVEQPQKKRRQ